MKYIASCSCGKDSLAMLNVIKNNPNKYPLDEIVICNVMATQVLGGGVSHSRKIYCLNDTAFKARV